MTTWKQTCDDNWRGTLDNPHRAICRDTRVEALATAEVKAYMAIYGAMEPKKRPNAYSVQATNIFSGEIINTASIYALARLIHSHTTNVSNCARGHTLQVKGWKVVYVDKKRPDAPSYTFINAVTLERRIYPTKKAAMSGLHLSPSTFYKLFAGLCKSSRGWALAEDGGV